MSDSALLGSCLSSLHMLLLFDNRLAMWHDKMLYEALLITNEDTLQRMR